MATPCTTLITRYIVCQLRHNNPLDMQWVAIFLVIQAMVFYLPRVIWLSVEGGLMKVNSQILIFAKLFFCCFSSF